MGASDAADEFVLNERSLGMSSQRPERRGLALSGSDELPLASTTGRSPYDAGIVPGRRWANMRAT